MQKKQIYVKIDEYKEILDMISLIRSNVKEARGILNNINDLKNKEDEEIEIWKSDIEDIQKKMEYMDKVLFGDEN